MACCVLEPLSFSLSPKIQVFKTVELSSVSFKMTPKLHLFLNDAV